MRVRLWIQQRHELPCASRKFQGIGCAMIGGEGDGVSNWTSSGVFGERVRGPLMHYLELEVVEKLLEEEMLMSSSNHLVRVMLMMLVIWEMEYLHEKFRQHHHHHVDEMTYHDDEKMKIDGVACLATITSRSSSLFKSKRTHDSINNVINAIVEMRICFHDVSIETSQEHAIWKICGWIGSSTFDSFKTQNKQDCVLQILAMSFLPIAFMSGLSFFSEDLIWSKSDGLTLNGTVYHDTFQFKKSTNIVGSRKVGGVWSLGFLRILKRCKVPLVGENGLTVVRNFEDLTELSKSESYEFMLNHKRDDKIAIFIETIEVNVCEETLDVVGFVIGLINNTTFVNVAIFNGFVEFGNGRRDAGDFGYFWDVGFSKGYIGGSGSWHFVT
ncbi:hypothetical protein Tco_0772408 [Tanacetum coccineum]|uniref:Uncharacterized protein n=1 Tax=Tanacetum coccineum TaxID=301880 RepID=A0ABQ4ZLG3_9ASTR